MLDFSCTSYVDPGDPGMGISFACTRRSGGQTSLSLSLYCTVPGHGFPVPVAGIKSLVMTLRQAYPIQRYRYM